MPEKMRDIALTDAERKAHVEQYPLPGWCKSENDPYQSPKYYTSDFLLAETPPRKRATKGDIFASSPKWKALRRNVLAAYGHKCLRCGSTKRITVDHIKPRSKYPELALDFSNLQVLCWPCNKAKSYRDETDYRPKQHVIVEIPARCIFMAIDGIKEILFCDVCDPAKW